jgi:hypothetical protein
MALANEREGTSVPSLKTCAEDGCGRVQWTSEKRGKRFVYSIYCYEHANVPLVDVPAEPVKPRGRRSPAKTFRAEVARRRLERGRS